MSSDGDTVGGSQKVERVLSKDGTDWIICKSTSHPGLIYYFNTQSREALWNISTADIEKARRYSKNSNDQKNLNTEPIPEPKEPPVPPSKSIPNSVTTALPPSSRVYNKQVINNQFPRPAFPISPFIVSACNQMITNPMNSLIPLTLNTPNPAFNANVWAVPPQHQIYIAPNASALVNQPQSSLNGAYNAQEPTFAIQNHPSTSLSQRFQNLRTGRFDTSPPLHFHNKKRFGQIDNRNNKWEASFGKNTKTLASNDLRQLLSAKKGQRKRSMSENEFQAPTCYNDETTSTTSPSSERSINPIPAQVNNPIPAQMNNSISAHTDEQADADSDWLEENILVQNRKLKLNVENLKKLARPYMDPDRWYIVADVGVLLNHLNFLNILCNSDDHCYLMVPQRVLAELHESARKSESPRMTSRARRAVSFLHQNGTEFVVIGDADCKETDTRCDYLLNCCSNLLEQNFHTILLSNEEELKLNNTSNVDVAIFTMSEIKQFLTRVEKDSRFKQPDAEVQAKSMKAINITVCNDLADKQDEICKVSKGTQFGAVLPINEQCEENQADENKSNHEDSKESVLSIKQTSEAGVQTDSEPAPIKPLITNDGTPKGCKNSEDMQTKHKSRSTVTEKNTCQTDTPPNSSLTGPQKKERRLVRSISVKSSVSSNHTGIELKQFRWRRKRNMSSSNIGDSKPPSTKDSSTDGNSIHEANAPTSDKNVTSINNTEKALPVHISDESFESESIASSFVKSKNFKDKTIVEETSTSGIISNTNSNVDTESESGNRAALMFDFNKIGPKKLEEKSRTNVMFEVKDQRMEDYLRVMNDEWVSRFQQIMEEILTQVLCQDKNFLNDVVYKLHGGGPWTIMEATNCIKIKFKNNPNIVDASSKLTNILSKTSDNTGRITANLHPSDYMEMYSYGVYLVDTLMSARENCEDLEIAKQSLLKLLSDIQNPNLDSSHTDTFCDNVPQDPSFNVSSVEQSPKIKETPSRPAESPKQVKRKIQDFEQAIKSPGTYNLRSKVKTMAQPSPQEHEGKEKDTETMVKFIRNFNVQDSFLSSLDLMKKVRNSPKHTKSSPLQGDGTEAKLSNSQELYNRIFNRNINERSEDDAGPKIIRNFNICQEYETRTQRIPDNYSENGENAINLVYPEDEYCSNGSNLEHTQETELPSHKTNELLSDYGCGIEPNTSSVPNSQNYRNCANHSPSPSCKKLNDILSKIFGSIKDALLDVHTFCENTRKEVEVPYSDKKKVELLEKSERFQVLINNLLKSLNSIVCREMYESENHIKSLLQDAGIIVLDIDNQLLDKYREMVGRCLQQAKILQESVALIVTVVKNKPVLII